MKTYSMSIVELEEETQDGIWNFASQRLLEIDLVSIDHFSGIFRSPWKNDKGQMILNHGDHRMGNVLLFLGQSCINILFEFLWEFLDDCAGVSDLLTVQFNEWQLSFFGMEFEFVVDILFVIRWSSFRCC